MKTDLGKFAKVILDKINSSIRNNTVLLQWKNSLEVIDWFDRLKNKNNFNFLKFDICSLYPSIGSDELNKALCSARNLSKISMEER